MGCGQGWIPCAAAARTEVAGRASNIIGQAAEAPGAFGAAQAAEAPGACWARCEALAGACDDPAHRHCAAHWRHGGAVLLLPQTMLV